MLTRITDQKILCVYIHVYPITKNWGPSLYNSLCHADNRKYFSDLCLMQNWREVHMFYLARDIWTCSCWEKGNFIMINKFKQPWESKAAFGNAVINAVLCWFYDGKKNAVIKVFTYVVFPFRFYSVVDKSWKI